MISDIGQKQKYHWWKHVKHTKSVQFDRPILSVTPFTLPSSYPLLRLPLPGTGPVEFTTGVRDYSVPSEPQGDLGERPDWVSRESTCTHLYVYAVLFLSDNRFCQYPNCIYYFDSRTNFYPEKESALRKQYPHSESKTGSQTQVWAYRFHSKHRGP